MKKNLLQIVTNSSVALLLSPVLASAVGIQTPNPGVTNVGSLLDRICSLTDIFFTTLLILSIVFVMIAAFRYLTAGGDPEKVEGANKQILYAAVAIIIALFARSVPVVIVQFVSSSTFTGCP